MAAPQSVAALSVGSTDAASDRSIERVYLHRAPVDMRKQIDRLVMLANDVIHLGSDPWRIVRFHQRQAQQAEAAEVGEERLYRLIQATGEGLSFIGREAWRKRC